MNLVSQNLLYLILNQKDNNKTEKNMVSIKLALFL